MTGAAPRIHAAHSFAPRTSHLVHGSPSASRGGSASPSLSTLGRLAGRPWCPPSLLRQSSAFDAASGTPRRCDKRLLVPGCRRPSSRLRLRVCVPARDAAALWLDPREPQGPGESSVPTLEASSAQVSGRRPYKTWAASAAFPYERGGLSEQRGWAPKALRRDAQAHRRLRAATSPQKKAARRRPVDSPWRGERREPFANQTIRSGSGRRQPVR